MRKRAFTIFFLIHSLCVAAMPIGLVACGGDDDDGGAATAGTSGANAGSGGTMGTAGAGGTADGTGGTADGAGGGSWFPFGDGETQVADGPGTVTAEWQGYCVATFTEDYAVVDPWGEEEFSVRAGEAYLVTDSFGFTPSLLYLTEYGPYDFEVETDADQYPFTADCDEDTGVEYIAVFADVTVYSDEALTTEICRLPAGEALPASGGFGFMATASGYNLMLGPFAEMCQGFSDGYITTPAVELFGFTTWLIPLAPIYAPR